MKMSNEKQRLAVVAALLLWCAALVGYRMFLISQISGIWLLRNLFLAALPLLWSTAFGWANTRKRPVLAAICFGLWLLFLPNAPYILTDLIHLAPRAHVPFWFELAMLWSCAGTGALLGYYSLFDVQNAIEHRFNKAAGWIVAVGSLMGCGFGIYLGRFLRWNSWDALTKPLQLFTTVIGQWRDPGPHPHPGGVIFVYGIGLLLGYLALRAMSAAPRTKY